MNTFLYSSLNTCSSSAVPTPPQPTVLYSTSLDGQRNPVTYPFEYVQRIELVPERTVTKTNNGIIRHSSRLRGKKEELNAKTLSPTNAEGGTLDDTYDTVVRSILPLNPHETNGIDTNDSNGNGTKHSLGMNPRILARQRALQDFKRDLQNGELDKARERCRNPKATPTSLAEISREMDASTVQTYSLPSPKAYIPSKPTTVPYTAYSTVHPGTIIKPVTHTTKPKTSSVTEPVPTEKFLPVTPLVEPALRVPMDPFAMEDEMTMEPLPVTGILPTEFDTTNIPFHYPDPVLSKISKNLVQSRTNKDGSNRSNHRIDTLKKSYVKNQQKQLTKHHSETVLTSNTTEMEEEMEISNPTTLTFVTEGSSLDESMNMIRVDTCPTTENSRPLATHPASTTTNFPILPALRLTYNVYVETSANMALAVSNPLSPGMQVLRSYGTI